MVQDQIRYDVLVQDALRGVIRKVLSEVVKTGLPNDHHFFITFLTNGNGVKVSSRLKERYPEQMTIVLQHQFWDLAVYDHYFKVSLSFGDVAEKLEIPFNAIQIFYDPVAAFEAAFDLPKDLPTSDNDSENTIEATGLVDGKSKAVVKKAKKDTKQIEASDASAWQEKSSENSNDESAQDDKPSADVVSLDAFRKNKDD